MAATDFEAAPLAPDADSSLLNNGPDLAGNGEAAPEEVVQPPRGLYFVRIPKPPVDDSVLKKHLAEYQAHVAKLKSMNEVLNGKREVVRRLKRQMAEARGLKETSEPEFQEKLSSMTELRKLRDGYISKIKDIKGNIAGLDCKNEQELEEKIRSLEHQIAHEGLPLREEKQIVQQISKLNSQRGKIKEYDGQKSELTSLEEDLQKVKAILAGMEGEFSVIRTERDATKKVVNEIWEQLQKAQEELRGVEQEQAEHVAAKDEALKALDVTRDGTNADMADYRDNRKFSLTVRDLVAAGNVSEAQGLVEGQINDWISKLSGDAAAWAEYQQLWAGQRRSLVSDLLPKSCANVQDAPRGNTRGGKAPPAPARGAEKAKSIIEQLMQEASKEAAAAKARSGAANGYHDSDDDESPESTPAPAKKSAAAAEPYKPPAAGGAPAGLTAVPGKLVQDPAAAAAAAFNFKVDLPKVPDQPEFVPPVIKSEEEQQTKEELREEQARKAAEAEERKRRRAEQAERKRLQAAEAAKRLEAERRERDAAARAAAIANKAAAAVQQQQQAAAEQEVAETSAAAEVVPGSRDLQQQQREIRMAKLNAPTQFEKKQMLAAAKRPKSRSNAVKQVQSVWYNHQGLIVFLAVMLLCIILGIAFLM